VVVAWLLIQAASIFFPAFDAPQWVMRIFIIVIVLGFPVALVLSWAFEITPEGIKLESEVLANQSCWYIKIDQIYDSVRNEPRFQALITKIFASNQ
jgi:hypothetical protein